jgi:leucyl-tRNA synthetase
MFLGPLEQSKPWDTSGIDGVSRFLRKLWNLFFQGDVFTVSDESAIADELKSLHKLIKKISWDIENFSFNTSVAAFMICVNELTALKCNKRSILSDLIVVLAPFAPFITEELWHRLGNRTTIFDTRFPDCNEEYLKENTVKYTVSFNGKARFTLDFAAGTTSSEVEQVVLANENSKKWMEGKIPKKIIIIPNKIINIVI